MLITVEDYRAITQDTITPAATVSARIEEATDLLDEELGRKLRSSTYTETLEVWYENDGRSYVYPTATPITAVPSNVGYSPDYLDTRLRNVTVDTLTVLDFTHSETVWSTVTYTGGYTQETCPRTLQRAIARLSNALINYNPRVPVGATRVTVGDVTIENPKFTGAVDMLVPGLSIQTRKYKRRRVRG
jgi:hypothetical protein